MPMPCANTIALNRHQAQVDADAGRGLFIEDFCLKGLAEKMQALALDEAEWDGCLVAEAVIEDHDHVDTYFMQALREFRGSDREALAFAYENLGRAVFIAAKELLEKRANDYLEGEAENEYEKLQERANCSCRGNCVC